MRAILIISFLVVATSVQAQNSELLAEAKKHYEAQEFPRAIAVLDALIEAEDTNGEAWLLKGHCYQEEEKYVAAIQAYERAEIFNPQWALPQAFHGAALINLEQFKLAEKKIKGALKMDPNLPEGHYYLGNIAYLGFRPNVAIGHYTRALDLRPEYRNALYMRAAAYAELENYGRALADYEQVLVLDPTLEVARFNAAVIRLQNREYEKAADLLEGIDPDELPEPRDYYYYNGEALYFAGRKEEACEYYLRAKELGDEESDKIYARYCVGKEEREEELEKRTIRMAF